MQKLAGDIFFRITIELIPLQGMDIRRQISTCPRGRTRSDDASYQKPEILTVRVVAFLLSPKEAVTSTFKLVYSNQT